MTIKLVTKNLVYMLIFTLLLVGCGGGGGGSGSSGSSGSSGGGGGGSKGPFKQGSTVTIYQLNGDGSRSSTSQSTTTSDDQGTFVFSSIPWTGATEFEMTGQYLDENSGEYISDGNITAIVDVQSGAVDDVQINIFTHMATKNIKQQLSNSITLSTAKANAKAKIEEIFNLSLDSGVELEDLDLTDGSGTNKVANTQLLKISAALLETSNPEETLAKIVDGLEDGDSSDSNTTVALAEIVEKSSSVDLSSVAAQMESQLGISSVPDSDDLMTGTLGIHHTMEFTDVSDAHLNTTYTSNEVTVDGLYGGSGTLSVSGLTYSIDGADYVSSSSTVSNGQKLKLQLVSSSDYATQTSGTVTIGSVGLTFTTTTKSDPIVIDSIPNTFSFNVMRNQTKNTQITSDSNITVTGINSAATISVSNGEYDVNGTNNWSASAGTVTNDSVIRLRHTLPDSFSSSQTTTLTIGGVSGNFSSFSNPTDDRPDAGISFAKQNDINVTTEVVSSSITITGINTEIPVTISEGSFDINASNSYVTTGTISNNATLRVKATSPSNYSTEKIVELKVGKMILPFKILTMADPFISDTTPNTFKLKVMGNQETSTDVISDTNITVSGINTITSISVTNGLFDVNASSNWQSDGNVTTGDVLRIKQTTSSSYKTEKESTITIGDISSTFKTITKAQDNTPVSFSFDEQTNVVAGNEFTSETVTITGIDDGTTISISGAGSYKIGDGAFSTDTATINNDQNITLKHTASSTVGAYTSTIITVGRYSTSFVTKTAVPVPNISTSSSADNNITTGEDYSFKPTNSGGEVSTWTITNKPIWAHFNELTGELYGRPNNFNNEGTTYSDINITAVNNSGSVSIIPFSIVVNGRAPVLSGTPNPSINEDSAYSFSPVLVDKGDRSNVFSLAQSGNGSSWLSINTTTGVISGTASNENVGVHTVSITATDHTSLTDTLTFTITVINTNDAPTISGTPVLTIAEDSAYSFDVDGTDVDVGDTLTYSISANKPSWLSIDSNGTITGTPTNTNVGSTTGIVVTVTDAAGITASLSAFNLSVTNTNDAPTITGVPITTATQDVAYTFSVTGADVDTGDISSLQYSITNNPSWMSIDADSGVVTGTPLNEHVATTNNIIISVKDSSDASISLDSFSVTVSNVNDAANISGTNNGTVSEDGTLSVTNSLTISDVDVDENELISQTSIAKTYGTFDVSTDGTWVYTLNNSATNVQALIADANVTDTILVSSKDGTDTETITVTITGLNDEAIISGTISSNVVEDTTMSVTETFSIDDNDTAQSEVQAISNLDGTNGLGKFSVSASGTWTYTLTDTSSIQALNLSETLSDGITVTSKDEAVTQDLNVTITGSNDTPVVGTSNNYSIKKGADLNITVSATDVDSDAVLSLTAASATNATVTILDSNGTVTFNAATEGEYTLNYTFQDEHNATASGTHTVTVTLSDAPVAVDDLSNTTAEDTPKVLSVTANDSDDNTALTDLSVTISTQPSHGSVVVESDKTITYSPDGNYTGSDSFVYKITDEDSGFDTADVNITVSAVNDAPTSVNDSNTTLEDTAITLSVMSNDSDVDGDDFNITAVTDGSNGTVTTDSSTVTYSPDGNYTGSDSFTYTISDGVLTSTSTVSITVSAVNDAPIAVNDSIILNEDELTEITNLLDNDTDVDSGDTKTITSVSSSVAGATVSLSGNTVSYTSAQDYNGTDSFTYTMSDAAGLEDNATVTLTVTNINDAPVVGTSNNYSIKKGADLNITVSATDVDSDAVLSLTAASATNATVTILDSNGTVTFNAATEGEYTLNYTFQDEHNATASGTHTVTVTLSDAPVAVDDLSNTTAEDTPKVLSVTANDSDDNTALTDLSVTISTQPSHGSVVVESDKTITYSPDGNYTGSDSFVYKITDEDSGFDTADVNITVSAVNDAPTSVNDSNTTLEDTAITLSVMSNDSDVDGDDFNITAVTDGSNGTVTTDSSTVTYSPDGNYTGSDSFTYTISDGVLTSTSTVSITVSAVNDAPIAVNDSIILNEDELTEITNLLDNDTDVDSGDTKTITSVSSSVAGATVSLSGNTVSYTSAQDYNGTDSFTYTMSDAAGLEDNATVTLTVTNINDAPVIASGTPITTIEADASYEFDVNATDVDGDTLSFSITNNPSWMSIDSSSGTVSGTPSNTDVNSTSGIIVTVSDGVLDANLTAFDVEVTGSDDTPTAFTFSDVTDVYRNIEQSSSITVSGINKASVITVSGGQYQINSDGFTSNDGTVVLGDTVTVLHTSSNSFNTIVDTNITIGGISDIFSSTTITEPTVTISTDDNNITESNLNGKNINMSLDVITLLSSGSRDVSRYSLNNVPEGVTIRDVNASDTSTVIITLDYNGTDFSSDHNFSVTVSGEDTDQNETVTSNTLDIKADLESGQAIDPYIVGAQFWVDVNSDGQQDSNELSTLSGTDGKFSFGVSFPADSNMTMVQEGLHNGVPFDGNLSASYDPSKNGIISPITSLGNKGFSDTELISLLANAGLSGVSADELYMDPFDTSLLPVDGNMTGYTDDQINQFKRVLVSNVLINSTLAISASGYSLDKTSMTSTFFTGGDSSPIKLMGDMANQVFTLDSVRNQNARVMARVYVTVANHFTSSVREDVLSNGMGNVGTKFTSLSTTTTDVINTLITAYRKALSVGISDPKFAWVIDDQSAYQPVLMINSHDLGDANITIVYDSDSDKIGDKNITISSNKDFTDEFETTTNNAWIVDASGLINADSRVFNLLGTQLVIDGTSYGVMDVIYNNTNFHPEVSYPAYGLGGADNSETIIVNGKTYILKLYSKINVTDASTNFADATLIKVSAVDGSNSVETGFVAAEDYKDTLLFIKVFDASGALIKSSGSLNAVGGATTITFDDILLGVSAGQF